MKIYSICWDITAKCNDNCLFCYRDKNVAELNYENNKRIIKKLINNDVGKISFLGGEPLLYNELFDLIEYAKSFHTKTEFSITTNAIKLIDFEKGNYIINRQLLQKIIDHFDWITLSLDAPTSEMQTEIGRNSNHYKRILILLEELKLYPSIKIKINTLVCKVNQNSILQLQELLSNYNISRWKLFQFLPSRGNAKDNQSKLVISREAFLSVIGQLEKNNAMKITANDYYDFLDTYISINSAGYLVKYDGENYKEILDIKNKDFRDILQQIDINRHNQRRSDFLLV